MRKYSSLLEHRAELKRRGWLDWDIDHAFDLLRESGLSVDDWAASGYVY